MIIVRPRNPGVSVKPGPNTLAVSGLRPLLPGRTVAPWVTRTLREHLEGRAVGLLAGGEPRGLGPASAPPSIAPSPFSGSGTGAMVPGSECVWGVHTLRARRNGIGRLTDHLEPAESLRYRAGSRLAPPGLGVGVRCRPRRHRLRLGEVKLSRD